MVEKDILAAEDILQYGVQTASLGCQLVPNFGMVSRTGKMQPEKSSGIHDHGYTCQLDKYSNE